MKAIVKRKTAVPVHAREREDGLAFDWDAAVRAAFLEGCLAEGLHAEAAHAALHDGAPAPREAKLRELAKSASLNAALGWLRLETCLARYGELAALALARCLDEAEFDARLRDVRSGAHIVRSSGILPVGATIPAMAIIQRGRDRLDRFWTGTTFRAA